MLRKERLKRTFKIWCRRNRSKFLFLKTDFQTSNDLEKEYSSSDIENSFLVIAATDNKEVNQTIYNDAKKRNILVSLSDDTEHSDFILPSSKNYDDITISVSTNGKSPALAKKNTDKLNTNDLEFYASILPIIENTEVF